MPSLPKNSATAPAPPAQLGWSALTHRGRFRANNEDTFLGLAFDAEHVRHLGKSGEASLAETDFVFAVSDGMGGARSGEFASRITLEKVTRLLPRGFRRSAASARSWRKS
jgi:PPM family protein phosphatase